MSYCSKLLLVLLLYASQETELSLAVSRFVYQKDMSEYCRRRVIPSVFLGRQVVEANSQILQFSKMELPYSCFISVRTEAASSIILVIQLMSNESLFKSCQESGSQLVVYEIGETFGGYWGPLPDHLMKPETPEGVSFYTLKTTQTTSTTHVSFEEETDVESEKSIRNVSKESALGAPRGEPQPAGNFISVELPIVNVSAELMPSGIQTDSLFNIDDSFDIMYDVTPGASMQYQSGIMPLMQFSIENAVGDERRAGGGVHWSSRYGVEYGDDFTPDSRLNFLLGSTTSKRKQHRYNKYNNNRRLNLKKNKPLFATKETPLHKKQQSTIRRAQYTIQPYKVFTRHYNFVQPPQLEKKDEPIHNTWDVIEGILRNLSKTKDVTTERPTENVVNLLHRISHMEHNISAYLAPNLSGSKNLLRYSPEPITRNSIDAITWRLPALSYGSKTLEQLEETTKYNLVFNDATESPSSRSENPTGTQGFTSDVDNIILNVANASIDVTSKITRDMVTEASEATTPKSSELLTGSLVDHESWENVVQSAPVMAILLNQSAPRDNGQTATEYGNGSPTTARPTLSNARKKRYVYAIPIENARPHKLPSSKDWFATTTPAYRISDAQEFAELVELQDDELHGRVALRYLRQYVGPVLFNLCDNKEARHVYLFNASRLVLAINNFTMERMTVVVTAARSLAGSGSGGDARCAAAHLECQVSGTRVCIDSHSACDGIPNCGSYDVYDEDRLMCGAAAGLRHNVCLAALTFLAVLITLLYSVHYWLKRCVPRVSDAFFIYTDAAENVLYLDSIMQAPCDGDESKIYFRSHMFQEEIHDQKVNQHQTTQTLYKRLFTKCFNFLRCKRNEVVLPEDLNMMGEFQRMVPEAQRMYSFAEIEIDKMMHCKHLSDAAVQTGSSLEMKIQKKTSIYKFPAEFRHVNEKPGTSKGILESRDYGSSPEAVSFANPYDELSMLKFFRIARSVSSGSSNLASVYKVLSSPKNVSQVAEEKELQCLNYERSEHSILPPPLEQLQITSEIHTEKADHVRKRLRFEEEITTIPTTWGTSNEPVAENDERDDNQQRRSIVLGAGKAYRYSQDLDAIEENEEQESREYKSYFWGGKSKTKKTKKKAHVTLR